MVKQLPRFDVAQNTFGGAAMGGSGGVSYATAPVLKLPVLEDLFRIERLEDCFRRGRGQVCPKACGRDSRDGDILPASPPGPYNLIGEWMVQLGSPALARADTPIHTRW